MDRQTPLIGCMRGHMPRKFGEKLNDLGVTITNSNADNSCHIDRRLISGASRKAAYEFGSLAASTLLDVVHQKYQTIAHELRGRAPSLGSFFVAARLRWSLCRNVRTPFSHFCLHDCCCGMRRVLDGLHFISRGNNSISRHFPGCSPSSHWPLREHGR